MKYPAIVTKIDGSFLVEFPGLDGCLTEGASFDEALTYAKEALDGWLESNYDRKLNVKEPETCMKLATKQLKSTGTLARVPVSSVLALAYQMRFSRLDEDKTLEDLAQMMQISQQNYSKTFENPKGNPTIKNLEKALEQLGYFVEINLIPKNEIVARKTGVLFQQKFKIGKFDLPEAKKKRT